MSTFLTWQLASLISRFAAMGLGIIQGIFIVRYLSEADYGLVGLVVSIGATVSILLHLGLVSGATREISAAEDKEEASQIFFSALFFRFLAAVPLSLLLFLGSGWLATEFYQQPAIEPALKLFTIIILVETSQGICNAALSGLQRFKNIFILQVAIAVVSLCFYIPLVYLFKLNGYFMAMLGLVAVNTISLWVLTARAFKGNFYLPRLRQVWSFLKPILAIGLPIYVVKIIFTYWNRLGPLYLGKLATAAELGVFNFGLFYATKLIAASDAITAVNLPVFTKVFSSEREKFAEQFLKNYAQVYALIAVAAVSALYWSKELVRLVVGHKYDQSLMLIPFLLVGFWGYSHLNILKSSIMVPAKMKLQMIVSYGLLFIFTLGGFLVLNGKFDYLMAMALAMALGGIVSLAFSWGAIWARLKFSVFDKVDVLVTLTLVPLLLVWKVSESLGFKLGVYFLDIGLLGIILYRLGVADVRRLTHLLGIKKVPQTK